MDIIIVGLNHKTAPVEIREKVSFAENKLEEPLKRILSFPPIREDMILSTCNRVEVYATAGDVNQGIYVLKEFLSDFHRIPRQELEKFLYVHRGRDAIRHVFRVASSLDSMVVGEPQILGQIKSAFSEASHYHSAGPILNRLLHRAFSVAKRIRTETTIGSRAISISFVAVELAKKIFGNLQDKAILLVGAGEMCELAARHLINHGVSRVAVTNRTLQTARDMAEVFDGNVVPFDQLVEALREADIIISSTASSRYVINYPEVARVIKVRRNRSMFFIDIAVPRDVDPRVNSIENVYLYDIDDLQEVAEANIQDRQKEAEKAEETVEREVIKFCQWYEFLETTPTIRSLRGKVEAIRQKELQKAYAALSLSSKGDRKVLDSLTSAIVKKILHDPITILKRGDQDSSGEILVDAVRKLFRLEDVKTVEKGEDENR
ncbi:MAG: glutamyl-tRNA reductase [Proteobacteria bacterium]|nr:glutamyl-tRNA reductase [Pseudomonadota bacterium]